MKIIYVLCEYSPKSHLSRDLIIKWTGWAILYITASLSPQPLNNKVVIGRKFIHGLSNMDLYPWCLTWLQPLLSTQYANGRDQHGVPNMLPFPRVISQLPGNRLNTLNCFHHGKGKVLALLYQTFWIQICLQCFQCFCQTYHLWTYRMLIHRHDIPHSIASDQGAYEVQQ